MTTIFLESGSIWVVPTDWNDADNSFENIGGGAGGGSSSAYGGGGGAYSKTSNVALTPGASINYSIGAAGVGNATPTGGPGGDTWIGGTDFASSFCAAKGGTSAVTGGGQASAGIGDVKYSGGNGYYGGGGAAGPDGDGANSLSSGRDGGQGGNGSGGAGGIGGASPTAGGAGAEFGSGKGSGGGGGAGNAGGVVGATGGAYGGGGGDGGNVATSGGDGAQGVIGITYTPITVPASEEYAPSISSSASVVFSHAAQLVLAGQRVGAAVAVKMELANETLNLWLGNGKVRSNDGQYWEGLGRLGGISGLEFGAIAATQPIDLTLSGLDAELAAVARAQYSEMRGRRVSVYLLLFDEKMQSIDLPYLCMIATIDNASLRRAGDTFTLDVTAEPIFNTKHMPALNLVTDADQQTRYPGDKIFDRGAYPHSLYWQQ